MSAWNDNLANTGGLSSSSRHIQFVYCSRYVWPELTSISTHPTPTLPHPNALHPHSPTLPHPHSHMHTPTSTFPHPHSHIHMPYTHTHTYTPTSTFPHPHSHIHMPFTHTPTTTLSHHHYQSLLTKTFLVLRPPSPKLPSLHIFSVFFRARAGREKSKEALFLIHQVSSGGISVCAVMTLSISVCCDDTIHLCAVTTLFICVL